MSRKFGRRSLLKTACVCEARHVRLDRRDRGAHGESCQKKIRSAKQTFPEYESKNRDQKIKTTHSGPHPSIIHGGPSKSLPHRQVSVRAPAHGTPWVRIVSVRYGCLGFLNGTATREHLIHAATAEARVERRASEGTQQHLLHTRRPFHDEAGFEFCSTRHLKSDFCGLCAQFHEHTPTSPCTSVTGDHKPKKLSH